MSHAALERALACAERARRDDQEGDDALLDLARRLRHLAHVVPGDRVLELGCGDGRFARALRRATRGECPLTAASLAPAGDAGAPRPAALPPEVEHLALGELPGPLAGRTFDIVVARGLLEVGDADLLVLAQTLLAPGGQLLLVDPNPWRPLSSGRVPPRADLVELLSELGFVRVAVGFEDLVPGRGAAARHLSTLLEQAPGLRALSRRVVVRAQRPPREARRAAPRMADHEALRGAVSVVVPCRNEEMNIGPLVEALRAQYDPYLHEIILVDDSSSDGTREVMTRLAAEDPRVRPVLREPPNGVGRALADGFRAATGRWVLTLDCDFQHLLPEVRDLFDAAARGRDVVVGSRFSRAAVVRHYPLAKLVANRAFHLLARLLLRCRFRDLTNNMKLARRDVLQRLPMVQPGFAANAETGLLPVLMGFDVEEVPASWVGRGPDMGASSFRLASVGGGYARVLWDLLRARLLGRGPYAAAVARGARGTTSHGPAPLQVEQPPQQAPGARQVAA